MTFNYKEQVLKTESVIPADSKYDAEMLGTALLAVQHTGEVVDQLKRNIFYNLPIDPVKSGHHASIAVSQVVQLEEMVDEHAKGSVGIQETTKLNWRIAHGIIGIITEAAELAEWLQKALVAGGPINITNLKEELGDLSWYMTVTEDAAGLSRDDVERSNAAKLYARHGDTYNAERVLHRDRDAELQALTSNGHGEAVPAGWSKVDES